MSARQAETKSAGRPTTVEGLREANDGCSQAAAIRRFVAKHAGRPKQRSEEWLALKAGVVGGSELAALMGKNRYKSFNMVVASKAGLDEKSEMGPPCWWGTLFESVVEEFVELDLGTRLHGTDVSVPAPEGSGLEASHANSPDGYCVLSLFLDDEGAWRVLTTDPETMAAAEGRHIERVAVLVEFKCPYRRRPRGEVPEHYEPQVWSGLALSPPAKQGLFIDAVFRKCSLGRLGDQWGYSRGYHLERTNPDWSLPVAWGLIGVYAAPTAEAADVIGRVEGPTPSPESIARDACAARDNPDPIDFGNDGECDTETFDLVLRSLDRGVFEARHSGACTPDGRGSALSSPAEVFDFVRGLARGAPEGKFLLGVVPWKLLEIDYVTVARRPGFLDEVRPLVAEALALAERIRSAPDPAAELALLAPPAKKRGRSARANARKQVCSSMRGLFDSVAASRAERAAK